jgi:RHS repeat-associated protein
MDWQRLVTELLRLRRPRQRALSLEEHISLNSQPPALNCLYTHGHNLISQQRLSTFNSQPSTSFYGYDGHGNVRYLTDTNAAVTDTYDYDAFGTLIAQSGPTPNNYLYCGEQFDADLALYYNRARYLDADSGRFWTEDKFEGQFNLPKTLHGYNYGDVNPINNIDPSGFAATLQEEAQEEGVSAEYQANSGKVTIKSAQKGTKKFVCQVGKICFERETAGLVGHHPLQKSLGGGADQPLVFFPSETHNMFHSIQNIFLQAAGLLPGNASKDAWIKLYQKSPASRIAAYQIALDTGKLVDSVCGFTPPLDLATFVRGEMRRQGVPGAW